MNELVVASLQFPTVVFTIALGIVLVYWLFVLIGALDIDLFDVDVDVSGAAKGIGDVLTGGAKGGAEAFHADAGHADAGHADADGDVDGGGLWHVLGLGDVPVTISVSLITVLAWVGSLLAMRYVGVSGWVTFAVFVAALVIALPIAALLIRPLAPVFAVREGKSNADYIGHVCTITTGRVDTGFGQATIEDGGTVLAIAVRCDRPGELARGDKALIIEFDRERSAYLVEPSAEMLGAERSTGSGGTEPA
ncbi:MAG: DUF1449 family protein [Deltaproteobacteria bacterium]|nr:MAG: DUF1449 family protein [Deltaproteobacteria bacterium]